MKLKFFTDHEWAEVRRYPHRDWQDEVASGDTRLGYMRWVIGKCDADGIDYVLADPRDLGEEFPPSSPMEGEDYEDWLYEVENLDTRLGLDAWVFERHARPAFEEAQDLDAATAPASATRPASPRL